MHRIYLGVDIGTTSAKCLAVRDDGLALAESHHPYRLAQPHQGWVEQDPEDYWRGLVSVVRGCLRAISRPHYTKEHVAALALSTQGDTLIVTNADGKPLLPALSWMDARASTEFEELLAEADPWFWYRETGSPLNALSSACKIRWLNKHRPEVMKAGRACYVADYLAKRLCGRFTVDTPSASWTPLYTPARRDWSQPVLDLLGVEREAFPDVLESGQTIGHLLSEAARELELSPDTTLVAGAFDQSAAAQGAGAGSDGRSVLSCGTAWVLYSVSLQPVIDPKAQLCTCCHTRPGETGLVLPFPGGSTYEWLAKTLGEVPSDESPAGDPLLFVPHLYGGLSPDWRGHSRGSLVGLTLAHNRADIRLALLRGLAFEARRNLEAAEQLSGATTSIAMVGGATGDPDLPQLLASVLNRPITVPEQTESACYGAAMIAAGEASAGWLRAQAEHWFQPTMEDVSAGNELFARYMDVLEAMTPLYEQKEHLE